RYSVAVVALCLSCLPSHSPHRILHSFPTRRSSDLLRCELVAEIRYEHVMAGRLRHGGRLVRFRPDRTPESCTYVQLEEVPPAELDRKSTRLNSSHVKISYAVFCLKKKKIYVYFEIT